MEAGDAKVPLTPYQRRLFVFLSVATFFEGYDFIALTQILPNLRADMALDKAEGGLMVSFITAGTVLAFFLVRAADRLGRRKLLTLTIAGYTVFTFASGLAPEAISFAFFQFLARMFLVAEWATSMIMAAEEFPASRRGMVMGVIQGCSSLGSVACAGVVPMLLKLPWGWRNVYFVGIIPLIVLAVARRGLRESQRFAEQVAQKGPPQRTPLFRIWGTKHARRMLQLALIWGLSYVCTNNAITFWKEFVMDERGFTDADVGTAITIAAVGSMPMVFYAGKLLDQVGRRWGAVVIYGLTVLGALGAYGLHGFWPLTLGLVLAIFGTSSVLAVMNAYTSELFPTDLRGDAFAWSNNLLGRIGYVLSPAAVGLMASSFGWGLAVQVTVIGPVLALVAILVWLPETRNKELEETAAI
ncbi:MAG: MFS transporter [Myxococcales bacterium]|nr:MFS transporter [Myxococcales bacterium]